MNPYDTENPPQTSDPDQLGGDGGALIASPISGLQGTDPIESDSSSSDGADKKKKKKKLGSSRGVETLFRNTYRVHVELTALADSKANFLISVNSIIMILLAAHWKDFVTDIIFLVPVVIVTITAIGSMIFAVLVARPRITRLRKMRAKEGPTAKRNLLFFGSYTAISVEDYVEQFSDLLKDTEQIYPAMMEDVYSMGLVLESKFARLQSAYGFLLYGMPVAVCAYIVVHFWVYFRGMAG
ncbi:MAG: Pycsar system effector family protein [Verrucomicrobiota bacterium]